MNFSDVIGQEVITKSLKRAVEEGKVSNAYIFHGATGSGRKLTASIFSAALNCKSITGEIPCEICNSCKKQKSGNYPDVTIIRPSGSSIKIKQIWEVISLVSKKPVEDGYKVIIFEDAEKMTDEAQNAFLKTLEEPNQDTVFILIVENLNNLLPTMQSRCQVFKFRKVDESSIIEYLSIIQGFSQSQIRLAAKGADGSIGKSLKILWDDTYVKKRNESIRIIAEVSNGSKVRIVLLADEIIQSRTDALNFVDVCNSFYRDVMIYMELDESDERILLNFDALNEIIRYSETLTNEHINCIMEIINNARKQIDFNVNFKNSIDSMLFSIMEVHGNGKCSRH